MMDSLPPRPAISLDAWYPQVAAVVPTPRTEIVRTSLPLDLLLDGEVPVGWATFLDDLARAADRVGGYPTFLRTGQGSGKHDWKHTCYVPAAADLESHVAALVEWSALVDILGLPTDVWVVREMLLTTAAFHAFGGMPITRERRYFVRDGAILGHHPYWPPEAIEAPDAADWRARLERLNEEPAAEVALLSRLSRDVSRVVPGAWSVDWLAARDGTWYCIDLAHAERSYVWWEHPHAPTRLSLLGVTDQEVPV